MELPQQISDLNIIVQLLCFSERQIRNHYSPPSCLKELVHVFIDEWLKIPLNEVKKLYDSISRRIEALQKKQEQLHIK